MLAFPSERWGPSVPRSRWGGLRALGLPLLRLGGETPVDVKGPQAPDPALEGAAQEDALEIFTSGALPESQQKKVARFGAAFFRNPPSTFAPGNEVPVGPDYIVGPGDSFRIDVWGMVQGAWTVTVDRNGLVSIPTVGTFPVAGLTFGQLKTTLGQAVGRLYSGFEISVSMGQLRSITVFVTGHARKPGSYTVSSLSTLVNALLACGGPDGNGSMRDVQVKRSGKVVAHFDLYDFLLKGDKTHDVRLQPQDVIFISQAGGSGGPLGQREDPRDL